MPGVDVPYFFAGTGVDGNQSSVECRDVDSPFVHGDAPIGREVKRVLNVASVRLWIKGPNFFPGYRVYRVDHAQSIGHVHHAVNHKGRRLHPLHSADGLRPGKAQVGDVDPINLRKHGESLLFVRLTVGKPASRLARERADDSCIVHVTDD